MDRWRRAKKKKKQAANGPRRVLRNEAKHRNTIFYVAPYQHFKVFVLRRPADFQWRIIAKPTHSTPQVKTR